MADGGRTSSTGGGDFGGIAGLDEAPLPTCYRHPDRETGVSCSNCGRPICPDCMTPAPVGFRCPVCMGEQRHGQGRARVITRSQTRDRWQKGMLGSRGLTVTKVLLAINVVMFVVEMATGAIKLGGGGSNLRLHQLGALSPADVIYGHEYWRMVTVMFLHGSVIHLLFNMWALLVLGDVVESILGRVKFVLLYFLAGLAGSVLIVFASPTYQLTVGASGAIFGIFGALAVYSYLFRDRDPMARALLGQIVFLLAINLLFTFSAGGVSWQGHIGGLVGGSALMAAFALMGRKRPGGPMTRSDIVSVVVAAALIVVATASAVVG